MRPRNTLPINPQPQEDAPIRLGLKLFKTLHPNILAVPVDPPPLAPHAMASGKPLLPPVVESQPQQRRTNSVRN